MKKRNLILSALVLSALCSCQGNSGNVSSNDIASVSSDEITSVSSNDITISSNIGTEGLEYYQLSDGTYGVVAGETKNLNEIVIPNEYNGKKVTVIGDRAFKGCYLTSIVIPSSITSIGGLRVQ